MNNAKEAKKVHYKRTSSENFIHFYIHEHCTSRPHYPQPDNVASVFGSPHELPILIVIPIFRLMIGHYMLAS